MIDECIDIELLSKGSSHLLELSTQSATTIHNKMCTVNKMGMYVPLGGNRLYEIDLRVKRLKKGDGVGQGVWTKWGRNDEGMVQ